jgi:hypothetical protein
LASKLKEKEKLSIWRNLLRNDFEEIRSYCDGEVPMMMDFLFKSKDFYSLLSSISPERSPTELSLEFKRIFKDVNSISDFQIALEPLIQDMIDKTTNGFFTSGINNLVNKPSLFISNHRDIALDPLFLNLSLFSKNIETAHIAIGDNLIDGSYGEKLMKLNKSFIVHREVKGFKEIFRIISRLSAYINKILFMDKESVWIAQKEGRAINGWDLTDSAVLKMLFFNVKKELTLNEWIKEVNLTPLSISYEYDPLDEFKGSNLHSLNKIKDKEVIKSGYKQILSGILGYKGRVQLSVAPSIQDPVNSIEELTEYLDYEIIKNYKLWPTNYLAAKELGVSCKIDKEMEEECSNENRDHFLDRFSGLEKKYLDNILQIYAAPVLNKKRKGLI